ncbi:MAG: RNA polymerase sigma factor [Ilumatobacteraceae bacterium]
MTDAVDDRAEPDIGSFLSQARPMLERAFVARFGLELGREAAADAVAYSVEHWPRLSSMENPVGYLYRVGQTAARRHHRWRRTASIVAEPATTDDVVDMDLQRALMRLRFEQRVAVLLIHGFGHSYREVAELLEVPTTTVTNHVNRGLARLRTILEGS